MARKKIFNYIAIILIIIGLVTAFYNAAQRFTVERATKETEIVLDWTQVINTAQRSNSTVEKVLADLSKQSVGGIFMKEMLLVDLENEDKVSYYNGPAFLSLLEQYNLDASQINRNHSYLLFTDREEMQRVAQHIRAKVNSAYCQELAVSSKDVYILQTSIPETDFNTLGLGFSRESMQSIKEAGLNIAVQIRFWDNCEKSDIDLVLSNFKDMPVISIGFNDAYLPGSNNGAGKWGEIKRYWADSIRAMNVDLLTLEFFKQADLSSLALAMDNQVLRCHTITETDASAITQDAFVDRFTLAASERNMKLLFVRFPFNAQVNEQQDLLSQLVDSLWEKGIVVKTPSETTPLSLPLWTLILCGLGVIGGAWLLMGRLRFKPSWKTVITIILLLGLGGLLAGGNTVMMQKLFALLAVVVFPTLAIIVFIPQKKQKLLKAIVNFILMSLLSLIGAVLMIGLLSDSSFMQGSTIFAGVKAAHLIPLLLIAVWAVLLQDGQKKGMLGLKDLMAQPLNIGMLILGGILVTVMVFYLIRTGNDNPAAVSSFERTFRAALDSLMGVRPRTKEFLLGHPLMLILCYWGYRNNFFLPVLVLASIGQVSMVNTFAHIHTPLLISVLRTVNGLVLGIVIGLILLAVVYIIVRYIKKKRAFNS
ncbi:MAG: DUF5693 family protein [Bacillota bacterium]